MIMNEQILSMHNNTEEMAKSLEVSLDPCFFPFVLSVLET
jgi:hypothetical protein